MIGYTHTFGAGGQSGPISPNGFSPTTSTGTDPVQPPIINAPVCPRGTSWDAAKKLCMPITQMTPVAPTPLPCPQGQARSADGVCRPTMLPLPTPPPNGDQPIDPYGPGPVTVPPTAKKPFYKKWWFWAGLGGGVIVIGGATILVLRR